MKPNRRAIGVGLAITVAMWVAHGAAQTDAALRLQARVLGEGEPVVLLGGGLLGADAWGNVLPLLAKSRRVINLQSIAVQYGLEGTPLPRGYSMQTEVDALRTTLDTMRVARADIVGMSHGGVTALIFAAAEPSRVRTLTLVEPPAFWVLPNHGRDDDGARDMQAFIGSLRNQPIAEADVERFRCLLGECTRGRSPRQAPQWPQWMKYRNSLRALYTIGDYDDDPARLRGLNMPVLVVTGADTIAFHRRINEILLQTLPRATALELTAGHNSPASAPDSFVAEWQKFQQKAAVIQQR